MMKYQEEVMGCKDLTQIIKGKRTKRPRLPSPLRLAMASSSSSDGGEASATTSSAEFIESREEEEDMANCLILLAQGGHGHGRKASEPAATASNKAAGLYGYECKTCNRCFPSFQALGGHRASHKKPKANTEEKIKAVTFVDDPEHVVDQFNNTSTSTSTTLSLQIANRVVYSSNNKSKVHECSICGAEFSSGQALGGHMRRHRTFVSSTSTASADHQSQEAKKQRNILQLDLNLPAPEDDHHHRESKFPFVSKEQVLVFSASPLVDCHY